ncbi:hypothetical protein ACQ4M3_07995 [Leptolyngbya sp. AN03gr2]|uniref:hypothetical protein n=1 Tax=unclassified Leptolyngbya TaxID=2650499 RepID=UPI003D312CB1
MNDAFLKMVLNNSTPEEIEAVQRAEREGTIFHSPDLGPITDVDGDALIREQIYIKPNGQRFRVSNWQFGCGNLLDTYYWVWGIGDNLKNERITVEAQHHRNAPNSYPSGLRKAFRLEEIPDETIRLEILRRRLLKIKRTAANKVEQQDETQIKKCE